MKEIKIKENSSGRRVFISAEYKYELIPKVELDVAVLPLEKIVYELIEKNAKNRKYETRKKEKSRLSHN